MTIITVQAPDVSTAWLSAAAQLDAQPRREAFHAVVHIDDPVAENPETRTAVDEILRSGNLQTIETVANTIFPAGIAASSQNHAELVERYLRILPVLRRFPKNERGATYFSRLIHYPTKNGPFDQIGAVIDRVGIERRTPGPRRARYEVGIAGGDDSQTTATQIYAPGTDNSPMAFPCLSHCSFQFDTTERLHLLATYRSQYLLERGYGNYLGLGRLLAYVAQQTNLQVGQLTVVAGLVRLENPILPVRAIIKQFTPSVSVR
ncbi:hypothetical protein O7630_04940 [Micromonospora sp. WMMD718]|uniref:hypothetical protein n=1 Tax=unclassified Micromonospora TaxID=2617518 RepID=UPI00064BAAD0|nr:MULTISPECIES: hypothetical protein [unclassified Micromonospora]MDG4750275.1 hypothetical protein [Micromonospora sp. WMMD718]